VNGSDEEPWAETAKTMGSAAEDPCAPEPKGFEALEIEPWAPCPKDLEATGAERRDFEEPEHAQSQSQRRPKDGTPEGNPRKECHQKHRSSAGAKTTPDYLLDQTVPQGGAAEA